MPVKKGKGKGKGKGKKKGKGKGKKKEKDGKVAEKSDKEQVLRQAVADAKLWEMRFQAADKSREAYRESGRRLMLQNVQLQEAIGQTEKDTVKVIGFLKKEGSHREEEVAMLQGELDEVKEKAAREKRAMEGQLMSAVGELESQVQDRTEELAVMQAELKTVKEFRKQRTELQTELGQMKATLTDSELEHQRTLQALEQRFFEEKVRLQKEANRRIAELSEKAHTEAVRNLDERTREVYRENLQMSEALRLHSARVEELERRLQQLETANRKLTVEKGLSKKMVALRVQSVRQYQQQISDLQEKVASLETSLVAVVREFDEEKERQTALSQQLLQKARQETEYQCCRADREAAELTHIRCMARRILEQRSEVEHFLLESLQQVKKEVSASRSHYCQNAAVAYREKVREATKGHTHFPAVRTFRALPHSTNSVLHDLDTASHWEGVRERVDISELTWEQKEQVLRLLFSKINEATPTTKPRTALPTSSSPGVPPPSRDSHVFLTQQPAV